MMGMMLLGFRSGYPNGLLTAVGVILALVTLASSSVAETRIFERVHAIAMHGAPKYPAGFTHFDYVNPDAPKGGSLRLSASGTFDSFNANIPKGNPATASGLSTESLMTSSADEAFTYYGLIAETITYPEDRSWITFHLNPKARWHDGKPITPEDVVFSFNTLLEKGRPLYRYYYANVEEVSVTGERDVTFRFSAGVNRELALIVGQLPILPKHYWDERDITKTTLEPPLGSGPYRIADFEAGRFVEVERVTDYWGKDLPVKRGINNFDRIRYDYYRDRTVAREAVKAGDIDYFAENLAKAWAKDYDVPAVRRGWLKRESIPDGKVAPMQAFIYNLRRPVFQDVRVRRALAYALDYEWSNANLFFGQYTRTRSFFDNSELASTGLPQGRELEILEPFRDRLPEEVFTEPYFPPKTDGSGWPRANLLKGLELLSEAGYEIRDMKLVDQVTGQPFRFEIMLRAGGSFRRIVLPIQRNLAKLGIDMQIREVDDAQYINRIRNRDYDMISLGWQQSDSPGNEQRSYWGSGSADQPSSYNYAGFKNEVVDELIEQLIAAESREDLIAHTRALDRILLAHHFVIPGWYLSSDRVLYWDKFSRPAVTPKNGTSISYWWFDEAKAAALAEARGKARRQEATN